MYRICHIHALWIANRSESDPCSYEATYALQMTCFCACRILEANMLNYLILYAATKILSKFSIKLKTFKCK